jgi:hypothetical protein
LLALSTVDVHVTAQSDHTDDVPEGYEKISVRPQTCFIMIAESEACEHICSRAADSERRDTIGSVGSASVPQKSNTRTVLPCACALQLLSQFVGLETNRFVFVCCRWRSTHMTSLSGTTSIESSFEEHPSSTDMYMMKTGLALVILAGLVAARPTEGVSLLPQTTRMRL